MKKLLVPALTLAAGFASGWFLQKRQAPTPSTPSTPSTLTSPTPPPAVATAPIPPSTAAAPQAVLPADASPAAKTVAAKATLEICRDLLKNEKNPARATGKLLAMLDGMDAPAITALATEASSMANGWYDSQSVALLPLVFGKLAELNAPAALQTAMQTKDMWSRVTAVSAVAEQMVRTNPAAAMAAVEKLPQGYLRRNVLASAAGALAREDGPAAFAMLQRAKVPPGDWAWGQMIGSWAAHDPTAAAAQLLTLPRQSAIQHLDTIAGVWARRDPGAAMSWAQSLTDPAMRRSALSNTISSIARNDPQQAISLAASQPAGDRRALMTGIASSFGESDGPGAVTWAKSLTDPQERLRCLQAIAGASAYSDTDTAKAAVELIPPGAMRNDALKNLVYRLGWSDPLLARDYALTLKPNEQALVMGSVIGRLAGTDMAAAEKLTDSLPPSGDNQWAWRSLASNKALENPAAALQWAGGLETEQNRLAATSTIFEQWGTHSPDKAAAALAGITDPNLRRQAAEKLAGSWAGRSPAEATKWAESLSGEERIAALSAVWNASAAEDPRAAGQSLATAAAAAGSATATDKLAASASAIAASWTGQSPSDAAAWALTLPDGKIREDALGQVAAEWSRYDPAAVSEWINALPQGGSRDAAIGQLVNRIVKSDPESAFTWATSVQNTEKQAEALKSVALAWKSINPDAARAAVQNAGLPEDIYNRLQEALR